MRLTAALAFVVALAGAAAPARALDDAGAIQRAGKFVTVLFDDRFSAAKRLMTTRMREAMPGRAAEQLVADLEAQFGRFEKTRDPRIEAVQDGFRVVRMGAQFAQGPVDFRVKVDGEGRIGGFFIVPYEPWPPPPRAAATPENEEPATPEADAIGRATRFAQALLDGRDADAQRVMTETVRAGLSPEAMAALRTQLAAQLGVFERLTDERLEAWSKGHRVVRMRALFSRQPVDLRVAVDSTGRIGGFFVLATDAPTLFDDGPPAEAAPAPPPASVKEIEVVVGTEADGLEGTLSLPDGEGPFPAAVLIHGSGPADRDQTVGPNKLFRDLAHALARRGVAVLRYDKRSFARLDSLAAVGSSLTVKEEAIDDAVAAVRLLRARRDIDAARVFVVGHSLGGSIAPRIALALQPRPAGLVLLAANTRPPHEAVPQQVAYIAAADGHVDEHEQDYLDGIREQMGAVGRAIAGTGPPPPGNVMGAPFGYWKDLAQNDPVQAARRAALPLLILQGGRDYQVTPADDFARWQAAFAADTSACLHVYPSADHQFRTGEGTSRPEQYLQPAPLEAALADDIATWVRERQCPKVRPE